VTELPVDPLAGGKLVELAVPKGLPSLPPQSFYWLDPFGNVWGKSMSGGETSDIVLDTASGVVTDLGKQLMQGRAATGDNGVVGERVLAPNGFIVWQARDEGGDLTFDSFDVFAMRPGQGATLIGESTVDIDGRSFSAPGDGNYLTVLGGQAWWVDGEIVGKPNTEGARRYSSIYSSPLDGSRAQRVAIEGARFPQVDRCAPAGVERLTYLVDATSTGDTTQMPELHAAEVSSDGQLLNDTVIWEGSDAAEAIYSVGVCGEFIAIGRSREREDLTMAGFVTIRPSPDVPESTIALSEEAAGAGRITATTDAFFFFEWGTDTQVFWSADGGAYVVGTGGSFGFGLADDGTIVMPSFDGELDDDASIGLRHVGFAG